MDPAIRIQLIIATLLATCFVFIKKGKRKGKRNKQAAEDTFV